jgi:predicted RND superfamily exporter protein
MLFDQRLVENNLSIDQALLQTRSGRFFYKLTEWPKLVLALSLVAVIAASFFLTTLTLNTTMEAFIDPDHPSITLRKKVRDIFGLSSPVVIAIVNEGPTGIFNPETLNLVSWFTDELINIPDVDPERITSLSTEKNIYGTQDGMKVSPFFEYPPETQEEANMVRTAVMNFPLYIGSLVANDGTATLIVTELLDESKGEEVYDAILSLTEKAPSRGNEIFVAGDAAVSGYFGKYVSIDSMRMTPVTVIVTSLIMLIAYRTIRGFLLPNLIVLGAIGSALGIMAAMKVPFYDITNAMPVLLVAIGVADGIHIMGEYYEQVAAQSHESHRGLIVRTMTRMWWPVTVTSITDIAGFMALSFASYMPPMKAFGLYASVGVAIAWMFSLLVIPSALVLVKRQESPVFQNIITAGGHAAADFFGQHMARMSTFVSQRPRWTLFFIALVILAGVTSAMNLKIDENRVENFQKDEPIYLADQVINKKLDGTVNMDVMIKTPETEDLFKPENLKRIEALQEFFEAQPEVKNATSIIDYLKQMNRAMNENDPAMYRLPNNADAVAQYFLLYSANSSPDDFEKYIDYDYRMANLRVAVGSGWHSEIKEIVDRGQQYIDETFNSPDITAQLSGRVDVDYHWLNDLVKSHFRGLIFALIAVWLMISFSFRSLVAGILGLLPVSISVLIIYAWMGITGLALDVSTSMFAAISLGCGVDFAVHMIDRLVLLVKEDGHSLDQAFKVLFPSTGRALFFNFSAIFFGFIVLNISQVPAIERFGILVCVAVLVSFATSLLVLPSLIKLIRPKFLLAGEV